MRIQSGITPAPAPDETLWLWWIVIHDDAGRVTQVRSTRPLVEWEARAAGAENTQKIVAQVKAAMERAGDELVVTDNLAASRVMS